jgi:hypothetical protein
MSQLAGTQNRLREAAAERAFREEQQLFQQLAKQNALGYDMTRAGLNDVLGANNNQFNASQAENAAWGQFMGSGINTMLAGRNARMMADAMAKGGAGIGNDFDFSMGVPEMPMLPQQLSYAPPAPTYAPNGAIAAPRSQYAWNYGGL